MWEFTIYQKSIFQKHFVNFCVSLDIFSDFICQNKFSLNIWTDHWILTYEQTIGFYSDERIESIYVKTKLTFQYISKMLAPSNMHSDDICNLISVKIVSYQMLIIFQLYLYLYFQGQIVVIVDYSFRQRGAEWRNSPMSLY